MNSNLYARFLGGGNLLIHSCIYCKIFFAGADEAGGDTGVDAPAGKGGADETHGADNSAFAYCDVREDDAVAAYLHEALQHDFAAGHVCRSLGMYGADEEVA